MKTHTSKVDSWFYLVVIAVAVLPVLMGLLFGAWAASGFVICGLVVAFMLWLVRATKYVVTGDRLTIHGGLFKKAIPLSSISSVTETRNPLSSPAFSLDRLKIEFGEGKSILISPKDKSAFMADLERAAG
jgi:membrane protein YdbS with pleckstrin-like domain